jgi:hypothetical protein
LGVPLKRERKKRTSRANKDGCICIAAFQAAFRGKWTLVRLDPKAGNMPAVRSAASQFPAELYATILQSGNFFVFFVELGPNSVLLYYYLTISSSLSQNFILCSSISALLFYLCSALLHSSLLCVPSRSLRLCVEIVPVLDAAPLRCAFYAFSRGMDSS